MKITPQEIAEHKARFANAKSAPMKVWIEGNMNSREFNLHKYRSKNANPLSFEMFFKIMGDIKQNKGGGGKSDASVGKNNTLGGVQMSALELKLITDERF